MVVRILELCRGRKGEWSGEKREENRAVKHPAQYFLTFKATYCTKKGVELYRGISKTNYHYERAKRGQVIPNYFLNKLFKSETEKKNKLLNLHEIKKKVNLQQEFHQLGDKLLLSESHNDNFEGNLNSPYTSWSRSEEVARIYAGKDGIILKATMAPPDVKFGYSPDEWNEQEVLVCGIIHSAEICSADHPPNDNRFNYDNNVNIDKNNNERDNDHNEINNNNNNVNYNNNNNNNENNN